MTEEEAIRHLRAGWNVVFDKVSSEFFMEKVKRKPILRETVEELQNDFVIRESHDLKDTLEFEFRSPFDIS